MGCQTEVYIGDDLTFTVNTHDPETGEASDADALPTYRVYEHETAAPILTGVMALLDAAGTTGFYAETIVCSALNGFEHGKSYSIYIEATVDSHPGTISYVFRALDGNILASIGLDNIPITAPAGVAGNFREMIVQLWRRFFRKATMTNAALDTYADDDATVVTTQPVSDDGVTQTQGTAT